MTYIYIYISPYINDHFCHILIYTRYIKEGWRHQFWRNFKMETQQLMIFSAKIISSLILGGSLVLFFPHLSKFLLLHPRKLRSKLQSQGIKGPSSPSFLYGNLPDINKIQLQNQKQPTPEETNNQELEKKSSLQHTWPSRVFSHIKQWQIEYGQILVFYTTFI